MGVVAVGVVGAIAGASFVGGYAVRDPHFDPYFFAQKVVERLLGRSSRTVQFDRQRKTQYESIFLRLDGEIGTVPVERPGWGGGLTSFGDSVLLLTHEGRIFAARSASDIKERTRGVSASGEIRALQRSYAPLP